MIIAEANRLKNVQEYYFSKKLQEIAVMQKQGIKVINLGIGSPDLSPSENTINKLSESAKNPNHHGYQSYKGIPELRKAIADFYLKTYKVKLDSEKEILPLMGSKEGIMHISLAFLNVGDGVLIPDPGYPTYSSVSELCNANIIKYNLTEENNWEIDIEKLKELDFSNIKLMWINYPNMPTGTRATDELFDQLIKLAHDKKFLICNDNPSSMVLNENPTSIFKYDGAMDVALELNSLSKSHNMAGWRIGWVAGNSDYINTILKVKSNMDSGMLLPLQHAAIEALKNSEEWHKHRNKEYQERRKLVWELLDVLNCKYEKNQAGMFVWAKIPTQYAGGEMLSDKILKEANVFITPGFIFGENGKNYIRVSLCSKQETLKEAIEKIKNSIN